jgi:hypothetical protein
MLAAMGKQLSTKSTQKIAIRPIFLSAFESRLAGEKESYPDISVLILMSRLYSAFPVPLFLFLCIFCNDLYLFSLKGGDKEKRS